MTSIPLLRPGAAGLRASAPAAFALALGLALASSETAHANRFGPPWQAEVVAEQTTSYSQPDRSSPPAGPLVRGSLVVVLEEKGEWTQTSVGFVSTGDLRERTDPWVAEVVVPSVSVRAKPNGGSDVRRNADQGSLLRVIGVSPGLDGDEGRWWATTEGYVPLDAVRGADPKNDWARSWTVPGPDDAPRGWWGEVAGPANVRAGATTDAPIVGEFQGGERVKVLAEEDGAAVDDNPKWYRIDGGRYAGARVHSSLVRRVDAPKPSAAPPPEAGQPTDGSVIVVDRNAHTLTLLKDGRPQFATYVALGEAGKETPAGGYSTFSKYRADDMISGSVPDAERSYDMPNVPFSQYYRDGGFAIHGTYWHDLFGTEQSQGCINLTWADAAYLFGQTLPELPAGTAEKWAAEGQGTRVVIMG
jgi:lipoprotein-anchoring transpeptidase ErfK/SrfK